ncbi:hypothetical protein F5X68DRAFT_263167 [Plectosphaerella plurivora]|uniref:Rhodopsin domain-containing protein n=1 Tax=Plectosphaerella plurivora TaxID=936078 RepID=A0A9P8V8M7_9PEZI|nr:hypothetical protein F5X68DRAFT_263167 [Plectosphaerella plurivora]
MMTSRAEYLDDSLAGVVFAVISSVLAAAFVMVALRVYARAILISKFGIDDWASVISLVFIVICGSVVAWNTRNGLGRHLIFLTPEQIEAYMKCFFISIVFYNVSLGAIKATLLLQYYRVFPLPTIRKVILVVGVIVGMWCVSQVLFIIFSCTPVSAFWTRQGTCIPNLPGWHINAAGNIITDVVILILPLPVINSLTLGMRQKIILFGIFCIGFFTCAISFVRIRFLRLSPDFTLTNVEAACWSVGELCAGLTCACLPTIRPRDDAAYNTPEFRNNMVTSLYQSLLAFESLITGPAAVAISRCKRMIGRLLRAKPGAGHLNAQAVQDVLSELPQHVTIALDICAQNAAVLNTKTPQGLVVEPFELLAPNATVMSCPGSLIRQFPASATILPGHVAADTNFFAAFTDLLAQFDVHALDDYAAKAKKGGDEHVEERDTTSPVLVTDML